MRRLAFASTNVGNTLVVVWNGEADVASFQVLLPQVEQLCRTYPERAMMLHVVTEATPIPGAEAREALREIFSGLQGRLLAMSVALEKSGIEGTLSRAVLSTLMTLSRHPFQLKVFSARREAVVWLGKLDATVPLDKINAAASRLDREISSAAR